MTYEKKVGPEDTCTRFVAMPAASFNDVDGRERNALIRLIRDLLA